MEEEQEIPCTTITDFTELPSLPYPLSVSQPAIEGDDTLHVFSSLVLPDFTTQNHHQQQQHYHCRIPELLGKTIHGCFYGWLVLSELLQPDKSISEFCLWNPVTRELIHLPLLPLGDDDGIYSCCLSSPPSEPDSVFLLTKSDTIVFYPLDPKRIGWTEVPYADEIRNISESDDGDVIVSLVTFHGNIYASTKKKQFIQVVVDLLAGVIEYLPQGMLPSCQLHDTCERYLIGNFKELFTIVVCYATKFREVIESIKVFKFDFLNSAWEELKNPKGRSFFLVQDSQTQGFFISNELGSGSYVHIIGDVGEVYSYSTECKTALLSSTLCPELYPFSLWEEFASTWIMPQNRFVVDYEETGEISFIRNEVQKTMNEHIEKGTTATTNQVPLLRLPIHILESIADHCGAVDYLNFRFTCKQSRLAAKRRTATTLSRLQGQSLVSPLLMVLDEDQGLITFTDPKSVGNYFTEIIPELIGHVVICASKDGWLLVYKADLASPIFFNPFTKDTIQQLPPLNQKFTCFSSFAFSQSPTSPLCVVAAFKEERDGAQILITSPGQSEWRAINLDFDIQQPLSSYSSRIFFGGNIYFMMTKDDGFGRIVIFDRGFRVDFLKNVPSSDAPFFEQNILVECDHNLLAIVVGQFGHTIEIYKLSSSQTQWESVDNIGEHMIYVSSKACFCTTAKISAMENKIYFSRFLVGKFAYYSLDTNELHTCEGEDDLEEDVLMDFFSTKQHLTSVWIEPNWS